jgi:hypothetical protein
VGKFVAKFRKDRDYNSDDWGLSQQKRRKRGNRHDPTKKLITYEYNERLLNIDGDYEDDTRKKMKRLNR